jgi:uncharacterized protein YndB with AHSA1/START domain
MNDPDQTNRVEHRIEHSIDVTATPEQAWEAIATASGMAAWMVPTRINPRVGGEVAFDFGDFRSDGVITDYTPNQRFAYEEPWPIAPNADDIPAGMREWFDSRGIQLADVYRDLEAASPIATEFLVESRSGGSCVIRVVTSAYGSGSDWEHEFFTDMAEGWIEMIEKLATYLNSGEPSTAGTKP